MSHVDGPATAPLGRGSLAVTVPPHGYDGVTEAFGAGTTAGDVTSLSFATYQPGAPTTPNSDLGLGLLLTTSPDSDGFYFAVQLGVFPSSAAAWQSTDIFASGVKVTWTKYKETPGSSTEISHDNQPWTTFASNNSGALLSALTIAALPSCARPATTFNLDDLVIGTDINGDDATTTDDFEPLLTTSLHATVSSKQSGRTVVARSTLTVPGGAAGGAPLTLWAKSAAATAYRQVASATTAAAGTASAEPMHPGVTTVYQWRYAGSADNAAAVSKPLTVRVASAVTLHAKAITMRGHAEIRAAGRVSHRASGTRVTLWRSTAGHRVALGHTRERASGSYSVTERLARGHYRIFVTAAGTRYNAAGISARRTITLT